MPVEIERKFLLGDVSVLVGREGTYFRQGYIATADSTTVRVRIAGDLAFLTVKGPTVGMSRPEYEYEIPVRDAEEMLGNLCRQPTLEKRRYLVEFEGLTWEVDEFLGENKGLHVAEVELKDEEQHVPLPAWVGEEVTGQAEYYNSRLAAKPFSRWGNPSQK